MLVQVADAVRTVLRSYDLIIRYGGDEFLCAVSGRDMEDVTQRLALVNEALSKASEHGSVTAGTAMLQAGDTPEDLVDRADAALYHERQQHRSAASETPSTAKGGGSKTTRRISR